ncbi:FAD-dependent monooxygenase [Streptomyces sp. NPDC059104]|uniref:oxidoreductase n=1 Tax=Streptomyces sp. NPDC059104 TaxID=3346729 RepID=UPI0036781392
MRIAVVGAGPGGLYFAALARQFVPEAQITVWERKTADAASGFGVVFSDGTLENIAKADAVVFAAVQREFAHWDAIDVRFKGETVTAGGHGFAALGRTRLLRILRERCSRLGVELRHDTAAPAVAELAARYDLVVTADGAHSAIRTAYAEEFGTSLDERRSRYMWLGTDRRFDNFTFAVDEHDFGTLNVHAYPYEDGHSTFIVEMSEESWRRAGFGRPAERALPPGASDTDSIRWCEEVLSGHLDGHRLTGNHSRWSRFTTVRNRTWRHRNIVLLGDAAHTVHFSIGSGTKLAMEDALSLASWLRGRPLVADALAAYEAERAPAAASAQRAAQASLEWFENTALYTRQPPRQFAFNLLTRSRRVTYGNLRTRDRGFVDSVERRDTSDLACASPTPPMFRPFDLGGLHLRNRVVVPPMATYTACDGVPGDVELDHLGVHALGGPALVFAGMTAVSAQGRATVGCPGLYTDAQEEAWARIVRSVHGRSDARLGIQLTHAGRRGATAVPAQDGRHVPLADAGWPLVAASPLPWDELSTVPREATRADMDSITEDFVRAARRALRAGFDAIELQYGHGHLMSGFLSPLTNRRTDEYGGRTASRLRFPLEVLRAVRVVWPADRALVVRISAADWAEHGTTEADVVEICRALGEAGADAVDVSTGEVVPEERPLHGRSYQTPYADLVRNTTGLATIAVGALSGHDDVNSIILAGRADLCAVGRAQLNDPLWTLHAAEAQGYAGPGIDCHP